MADKDKPTFRQKWRTRASDTRRLIREPGYAKEYFPRIFVRAWRTRGGGWYGIGYLVTFLYLEITMTIAEISEASSTGDFIGGSIWGIFPRWLGESLGNMVQSFLWPLTVIEWLGGLTGAVALLAIHFGFEYVVRPFAEARFPELAEDRVARQEKKRAKLEAKQQKMKLKKAKQDKESDTC